MFMFVLAPHELQHELWDSAPNITGEGRAMITNYTIYLVFKANNHIFLYLFILIFNFCVYPIDSV